MNSRSVERILGAASACTPQDDREAAIIGSIAATLIEHGHFLPQAVAAHAADNMGWAFGTARELDASIDEHGYAGPVVAPLHERMFPKSLRGYPTMSEIRIAATKFKRHYDPPAAVA